MRPSHTRGGRASAHAVGPRGLATACASTAATASAAAVKPPRYNHASVPSACVHSQAVPRVPASASTASHRRPRVSGMVASAQPISSAWARVSVPKYARLTLSGW